MTIIATNDTLAGQSDAPENDTRGPIRLRIKLRNAAIFGWSLTANPRKLR